ncbi:MAG: bis(5'-nucleosyl)-tetraphosphatase (symmetrical) YqeK [Spirochaetota bacterium]
MQPQILLDKLTLAELIKYFQEKLIEEITDTRLQHSYRVAEIARELANRHGYPQNPERAYLAGLLHDISKQKTKEFHEELFVASGKETYLSLPINVYHAFSGPLYVHKQYHWQDEEIFLAMQNHTLGSEKASLLEEILYVADFLGSAYAQKQKEYPDWLEKAKVSLAFGCYLKSSQTIADLLHKKLAIHPRTIHTYHHAIARLSTRA